MSQSLRLLAVALSLTVLGTGIAYPSPDYDIDGGTIDAESGGVAVGVGVDPVLEELVAKAGARSNREWVPVPAVGVVEDDLAIGIVTICRATRWVEILPGDDRVQVIADAHDAYDAAVNNAFYEWRDPGDPDAPCPFDAEEGLPAAVLEEGVRKVALDVVPRPVPRIPPGIALAGLRAYLVTGHELQFGPRSQLLDLGVATPTVTFSGTGTTTVLWGDGTSTTHAVPGTPYPEGRVSHTYTERGTYTVQVVDTWTVTYEVDGVVSGILEATLDPVSIDGFVVEEYRAVRTANRH